MTSNKWLVIAGSVGDMQRRAVISGLVCDELRSVVIAGSVGDKQSG